MIAKISIRCGTAGEFISQLFKIKDRMVKDKFKKTSIVEHNECGAYSVDFDPDTHETITKNFEKEFTKAWQRVPIIENAPNQPKVSKKNYRQWLIGFLLSETNMDENKAVCLARQIIEFTEQTNLFHDQIKTS